MLPYIAAKKHAKPAIPVKNVILGVVGGIVGGFLGNLIGIGGGWVTGVLLSIGGACLVVWLFRKLVK